jgi:hypothetical protein
MSNIVSLRNIVIFLIIIIIFFSLTNKEKFWNYGYGYRYPLDSYYMNNNLNIVDSLYNPFGYGYYNWMYPNPNYISTVQYATVQPSIIRQTTYL